MDNCTYSSDRWLFLLRMVRARLSEHALMLDGLEARTLGRAVDEVITEMEDVRALIEGISEASTAAPEAGLGPFHAPGCPRGDRREPGERGPGAL